MMALILLLLVLLLGAEIPSLLGRGQRREAFAAMALLGMGLAASLLLQLVPELPTVGRTLKLLVMPLVKV